MTNPTPHGQVPEALRLADEISKAGAFPAYPRAPYEAAAAELRRIHAENESLAAMVEAQQPTTHVPNPAEIEHVAGDVSKNGAEVSVSTQQQECGNTPYDEGPFALAQPVAQRGAADGSFLLLPQRPKPEAPAGTAGLDWDAYSGTQILTFGRDCSDAAIAALRAQQPAPAAQAAVTDAMIDAGKKMLHNSNGRGAREKVERIFNAMIAAAPPTTPAGSGKGE